MKNGNYYDRNMKRWAKRREDIKALRAKGWKVRRIADKFEISAARVCQIVNGEKKA
jgi:hypothetical protein